MLNDEGHTLNKLLVVTSRLVEKLDELWHYEVKQVVLFASYKVFKKLHQASCRTHLTKYIKTSIDYYSHRFVEDQAQAELIFLAREAVIEYIDQAISTCKMN